VLLSAWEYGTTFGVAADELHVRSLATWSFESEAAGRNQHEAEKLVISDAHPCPQPSFLNVVDPPACVLSAQRCS